METVVSLGFRLKADRKPKALEPTPPRWLCLSPPQSRSQAEIWGVPKIRGTLLGITIIRILAFSDVYGGAPDLGKPPYIGVILKVS